MGSLLGWLGGCIGRYLSQPVEIDHLTPPTEPRGLLETLQPGDVLLVEGNSRVSGIIKYLTQSTWSHAALFVGDRLSTIVGAPNPAFVEADIVDGVRAVTADAYAGLPTRICRPAGIAPEDLQRVLDFAITRIGHQYDLRNVIDLARYLFPTPPVPQRFRRRMLSLGSGDPTRAICSTLIAQAFQSVRYPILPRTVRIAGDDPDCPECVEEVMQLRHFSLFAPRDFDVSPYFEIVKPGIARAKAHRQLAWIDHGRASRFTGPHRSHRAPMQ
ncbi:MAG: lipo-like protein [Rhodocyclaceae bacterium]|nr:lipo-like protein [Rhodocyclaceae bacterium]